MADRLKAHCVAPDLVVALWPHVRDDLKRAIERGPIQWSYAERQIFEGNWLLWIACEGTEIKGVCAAALIGEVCEIIACGGRDVHLWLHFIERIEEWARAEGCTRTRIIGRKGWKRLLPAYRDVQVVLERAL